MSNRWIDDQKMADTWPELMCVLCGLIVEMGVHGSVHSWPTKCSANAGGEHINPHSTAAKRAAEIHAAWLRSPFDAPAR